MSREERKLDHLNLALQSTQQEAKTSFDDVRLVHRSLPQSDVAACQLGTELGGVPLGSPLIINAMTGGAYSTMEVNRSLAIIARETGVSLAVGSQKAALHNPDLIDTYRVVRETHPAGVIIANLSADSSVDDARRAVEMIEAQFLQLHVNVPQEIVMPEGDRHFAKWLEKIAAIVEQAQVPVIVKEVGFGMARETYEQLQSVGVRIVDVGGRGGTNFIWIENQRRAGRDYSYLSEWGQTTAESLLESRTYQSEIDFISSGGLRHPLDMVKSFVLGAKCVGLAGPVLRLVRERGVEGAIEGVQGWHEQLRAIMTMAGAQCVGDLRQVPYVLLGETKDWWESLVRGRG